MGTTSSHPTSASSSTNGYTSTPYSPSSSSHHPSSSSSSSSPSRSASSTTSTSSLPPRNFLTPDTIFSNQHNAFLPPSVAHPHGNGMIMPSLPLLLNPNGTGIPAPGSSSSYPFLLGYGHHPSVPIIPARMENAGAVKNNFNVHKNSIHFYPYASPKTVTSHDNLPSSSSLFLTFQYDATEPCVITLYFMTIELPPNIPQNNNPNGIPAPVPFRSLSDRLMTKFKPSGIHYLVTKGFKQTFDQRTARRIVLDTSTISTANSYSLLPSLSFSSNDNGIDDNPNNDPSDTTITTPTTSNVPSSTDAENELFDLRLYTAEEVLHIPSFISQGNGSNSITSGTLQRTSTGEAFQHTKQTLLSTFPFLGSYVTPLNNPHEDSSNSNNSNGGTMDTVSSIPIPPTMFPIVIVMEGIPPSSVITSSLLQLIDASSSTSMTSSKDSSMMVSDGGTTIHSSTTSSSSTVAQMQATYGTITLPSTVHHNQHNTDNPLYPSVLDVRVLQQKIQVGTSIYIIRELFGSDGNLRHSNSSSSGSNSTNSSASSSSDTTVHDTIEKSSSSSSTLPSMDTSSSSSSSSSIDPSVISGTECVICLTEPRNTAILPCRHTCLCNACAQQLRVQTNKCPICRTPVKSLLVIDIKP